MNHLKDPTLIPEHQLLKGLLIPQPSCVNQTHFAGRTAIRHSRMLRFKVRFGGVRVGHANHLYALSAGCTQRGETVLEEIAETR
jgi:hypothetical protein